MENTFSWGKIIILSMAVGSFITISIMSHLTRGYKASEEGNFLSMTGSTSTTDPPALEVLSVVYISI